MKELGSTIASRTHTHYSIYRGTRIILQITLVLTQWRAVVEAD